VNEAGASISGIAEIDGSTGTIQNYGTLSDSVTLGAGGSVSNFANGTILYGLYISGGAGTLSNAGLISGMANFAGSGVITNTGTVSGGQIGVTISGAGTVTNGAAGSSAGFITGTQYGVDVSGSAGQITNYGTIENTGGQAAILLQAGGYVVNQGLLLEQAGQVTAAAVSLKSGGTLVNNATLVGAPFGAYAQAGTVINNATVSAAGYAGDSGVGVELNAALLINNASIVTNWQQAVGVVLVNQATVVNNALLSAISVNTDGNLGNLVAVGAYMLSGGTLVNTGTLTSNISQANSFNAVLNAGVLVTGTLGVSINNSGSIIGASGVVIERSQRVNIAGVYSYIDPKPNVTLVDSGLIDGTSGTAIQFGDGYNLLELLPSATLTGGVRFGSGTNILGLAAGTGSLAGLGSAITGLGTIDVFSGGNWTLSGTIGSGTSFINSGTIEAGTAGLKVSEAVGGVGTIAVASGGIAAFYGSVASGQTATFLDSAGTLEIGKLSAFAGTIANFGAGDTIVLLGTTATSAVYANNLLTISNGANPLATLSLLGAYAGERFATSSDNAGNTDITALPVFVTAPCFAAGTRLRTTEGETPVEALQIGTNMVTASGGVRPVVWLGHRRVNCRNHPKPESVLPIRIAADAFAPGTPHRELFLSPDHAVEFQNTFIPVRYLVNGMTVKQIQVPSADYWHVELDSHDVLLAEGLAAESYLDTGNRNQFDNSAISHLYSEFNSALPLTLAGPTIVQARVHLQSRARALGYEAPPPFINLQIADTIVAAAASCGEQHRFLLPPPSRRAASPKQRRVTIASDIWVPAERDPTSEDQRQLGVCIAGIVVDGKSWPLDAAALCSGFHPIEHRGAERWRWTDGSAVLLLPSAAKVVELCIKDGGVRAQTHTFRPAQSKSDGRLRRADR
jgi:hypothetical protein